MTNSRDPKSNPPKQANLDHDENRRSELNVAAWAIEWWLARRYFSQDGQSNRFISLTAFIGIMSIALGVAVLLVVLSVMNGFESELKNRLLSMTAQSSISPVDDNPINLDALRLQVMRAPHVESVVPYVEAKALAVHEQDVSAVMVRGIDVDGEIERKHIASHLIQGAVSDLKTKPFRVIIGDALAQQLHLSVGNTLLLAVPQGNVTPIGLLPRTRSFTVVGIVHSGLYELDSHLLIIRVNDAVRLFQLPAPTGLDVAWDDPLHAAHWVHQLAVDLGGGFYVSDWSRSHENIFRSIQTTKGILRVLLMLVLAVAAFNIVASLMLMVRNKHREIAILRTQGLAPLSVARVFVWQGCGIALWGVVIGLSVGLILCHYLTTCVWWIEHQLGVLLVDPKVYSIDELPVAVHIEDAIIIGVSALVLGILATIVPAITAGRLVPAEILRHD